MAGEVMQRGHSHMANEIGPSQISKHGVQIYQGPGDQLFAIAGQDSPIPKHPECSHRAYQGHPEAMNGRGQDILLTNIGNASGAQMCEGPDIGRDSNNVMTSACGQDSDFAENGDGAVRALQFRFGGFAVE